MFIKLSLFLRNASVVPEHDAILNVNEIVIVELGSSGEVTAGGRTGDYQDVVFITYKNHFLVRFMFEKNRTKLRNEKQLARELMNETLAWLGDENREKDYVKHIYSLDLPLCR